MTLEAGPGNVDHGRIVELIAERSFGPIMSNVARALYVEAMIGLLLGQRWRWTSDWEGWDFQRDDGRRVEVKQSAALQTWTRSGPPSPPKFSIRRAKGHYVDGGSRYELATGRLADLYIFAHHPVVDDDLCDQREPNQWDFYLLREQVLPQQDTISLNPLRSLGALKTNCLDLARDVDRQLADQG